MQPLMKSINQTSRSAVLYRNNALSIYGLKEHQHAYIIQVCQSPGISQDQLAKILCINKSNVARQLIQLESLGYFTRETESSNKRQLGVYPTQKSKNVYPVLIKILSDWNRYLLEDFTEEEQIQIKIWMERVAQKAMSKGEIHL